MAFFRLTKRKVAGVVERGGLEIRYTACCIGGSNPSLSAKVYFSFILMKNAFFSLLFVLISISIAAQEIDLSKMSPMIARELRMANMAKKLSAPNKNKTKKVIFALVRLQEGDNEDALLSHGCKILDKVGNIYFTLMPINSIQELSIDSRVVRMEATPPKSLHLDSVAKCHDLIPAYEGKDLPQAYTGSGVVVGFVDVGFDFTHPMFFDKNGKSRIKSAWDIYTGKGTGYQSIGSLYTTHEDLMKAKGTCDSTEYHGTHVMGIAAGSPVKDGKYRGMAYDADIVASLAFLTGYTNEQRQNMVNDINRMLNAGPYDPYWDYVLENNTSVANVMEMLAIKHIMDYASEHNQPCVVNCSFGKQMTLTADYSLMNELFSAITGPGRIIVCSAGNNSDTDIYRLKQQGETLDVSLWFKSTLTPTITLRSPKPFTITMRPDIDGFDSLKISSTDIPLITDMEDFQHYVYKDFPTNLFGFSEGYKSIMQEGDTAYSLKLLLPDTRQNAYKSASLSMKIEGEGVVEVMGQFNGAGFTRFSLYPVNSPYTLCEPAIYNDAIAVGLTSYRKELQNIDGKTIDVLYNKNEEGKIVSWSGTGPTLSGNIKPDIAAAGYNIVSSFSSLLPQDYYAESTKYHQETIDSLAFDDKTYYMNAMCGTSMAAPVVTGIIALWLQADPTLTPERIKEIFALTASHPEIDDTYPNNRYGYGVIEAYKGLCEILNLKTNIENFPDYQPRALNISVSGRNLVLDNNSDITVSIYTLGGQLIKKTKAVNGVVYLSDLPAAVYAVQTDSHDPLLKGSTLIRLQ